MKRQIRKETFETNSSSIHTIAISRKKTDYPVLKYLCFEGDEFGWEVRKHQDPKIKAKYLYTAISYLDDRDTQIKKVVETLIKHGCAAEYVPYNNDGDYWANGYIDHPEGLYEFLGLVLNNEDTLLEYLFGDSAIYTYNDNMDCSEGLYFYKELDGLNADEYLIIRKGN